MPLELVNKTISNSSDFKLAQQSRGGEMPPLCKNV